MNNFAVKVEGLKAVERALRELPDQIAKTALRGAVAQGAKIVRDEARAKAPVYTGKVSRGHPPPGTLRRSIITKHIRELSGRERQTFFVAVRKGKKYRNQGKNKNLSQDAYYWSWVEFGYRAVGRVSKKNGANASRAERKARRDGARQINPQPFMRPAFESKKMQAMQAIKDYLLKGVDVAARVVRERQ